MKKALKVMLAVLTSALLIFCGLFFLIKNPELLIDLQLIGKSLEAPEVDAQADLDNGEIQCYSLNGFGPYFPGISADQVRRICRRGREVNFIGTSDGIQSREHGVAIYKAEQYAQRYNQYMVGHALGYLDKDRDIE